MTDSQQTGDRHHGFRVADLPQNRPVAFELHPERAALTALAEELGLSELRKLRFTGEISSLGKHDWQLNGTLGATVVQPCVVTLEPVVTRIDVAVERRYLAEMEIPEGEEEIEMPEDENAELLGSHIDPATVMVEELALAIPAYPRKDDVALPESVFTEPGKVAMTAEQARPFAGLAALRDKLADDDKNAG